VSDDCHIEGCAIVGRGTKVQGSTLSGPVLIGRNCIIENSTIGPYAAIGDGCVIVDCLVEDSVVQDNCRLSQLTAGLRRSVLGSEVQVTGDAHSNGPLHLILGDMAQIRML
jgi:glucose-1-phosphate thymidylyltransferase